MNSNQITERLMEIAIQLANSGANDTQTHQFLRTRAQAVVEHMKTATLWPVVGNFGPGFDPRPRPLDQHPTTCQCQACNIKHQQRLLAREETRTRYGI